MEMLWIDMYEREDIEHDDVILVQMWIDTHTKVILSRVGIESR